jgi:hypothetical protein
MKNIHMKKPKILKIIFKELQRNLTEVYEFMLVLLSAC